MQKKILHKDENVPVSPALSYFYNLSVMLFFALFVLSRQIITSVFLTIYFNSIESLQRYVNNANLLRIIHANTASFFFSTLTLHIKLLKVLYYGFYLSVKPLKTLFLLIIITVFLSYVLPWGQMSFWVDTVITSFCNCDQEQNSIFVTLGLLSFFKEVPKKDALTNSIETPTSYSWTQVIGITIGVTLTVIVIVGVVYYFGSGPGKGAGSSSSAANSSTSSVSSPGDVTDLPQTVVDVTGLPPVVDTTPMQNIADTTVQAIIDVVPVPIGIIPIHFGGVLLAGETPEALSDKVLPFITKVHKFLDFYVKNNPSDGGAKDQLKNVDYLREVLLNMNYSEITQRKLGASLQNLFSFVINNNGRTSNFSFRKKYNFR
jgi:hypothetical protein